MKHLYVLLLFIFFGSYEAKAVLPNGTVAPDWTLTDLDGNTHNLHSILNSGKHVVIDFSATWCGPCWNYHNTHTLSTLWNLYGPNGTDEIMVFFIEGDITTTTPCLYGLPTCQGGTMGNWVANTPYPIIDLQTSEVRNQYQITYWPTLYAIRAQDKRVFEVGQRTVAQWESWLFQSFAMDYTGTVNDNTCRGNGSVSLDVTGGYASKFYQWSNGGFGQTISNLQAGTYSCRITDSNNFFIDTDDFVVEGVPDLEADLVEQINISCFGQTDGVLEVEGSGGGGGYSYEWSNGENSARIENLPPGEYSVTILDANDCDVISEFDVEEPSALFGTAYTFDAPCTGDGGYVELAGLFGTAPYLYDMGGSPQADPYFYDLEAGDYTYNVTDANGCLFSGEFEIEQVPGPTAMASNQGPLSCTNLQTIVTGQGSATGQNITYLWSTQDGQIVSGGTTLNAVVNAAGTYTLKVTNTSNNCFTEASTVVASTAVLPLAVVADPSPLTCSLTQTTLDGTGSSTGSDFTYLWTTQNGNIVSGETSLTPVVDEPGDYQLQVTNNSNGCVKTTMKALAEDVTAPALTVTDGEITCTQTSVEICGTADPALSITWQIGEQQFTSNCVTVNQAGSYNATVVGDNGCSTVRTSTVTASADLPQVAVQEPEEVNCVVTQITIVASLQGNPEDYTITWTTQDGNIVSGENTLTPVVNQGGTYTLSVVNNANGCTTLKSTTVEEDTAVPVSEFTHVQNGEDLVLTSGTQGTITSLEWDLGNGERSNDPTVTVQYPSTGTYTICLTVINDCGEDTECIEVLYVARLGIQVNTSNVKCFSGNDGSISVVPNGGLQPYEIAWEGPNGFTSTSFDLTGLAAGTYRGVLTDAQGTIIEITQEVTEADAIVQTSVEIVNDVNNGNNGSVTPTIEGGTGSFTYLWSNGSTASKLDKVGADTYFVTVTDENGCQKVFGPYVVENSTNAEDFAFLKSFTVTPNPASDKVIVNVTFVQPTNGAVVSLYNALGQKISTQNISAENQTTFDVSLLDNGMYTVEVRDGNKVTSKKLVVVH